MCFELLIKVTFILFLSLERMSFDTHTVFSTDIHLDVSQLLLYIIQNTRFSSGLEESKCVIRRVSTENPPIASFIISPLKVEKAWGFVLFLFEQQYGCNPEYNVWHLLPGTVHINKTK